MAAADVDLTLMIREGQNSVGAKRPPHRPTSRTSRGACRRRLHVMNSRTQTERLGMVGSSSFRLEELPIPQPGPGQMLLHTRWLSLDPYMRGRMSDAPSYAKPVGIGDVMEGGFGAARMVPFSAFRLHG